MKKTNIRTTEGSNQREKQDKRMIPICVLQYLIENTNCNNRATVQDISNGLGDYGVFANRDTVQKTLTDLISRKDDLIDMGFPEIKYEEIRLLQMRFAGINISLFYLPKEAQQKYTPKKTIFHSKQFE